MQGIKQIILGVSVGISVASCTYVDDYMLGKDNTPKPKELKPVKSTMVMQQTWSTQIGQGQKTNALLKIKPVIAGDVVYTADHSGTVAAINKSTGAPLWTKKIASNILSGPTASAGVLVITTDDANIIALSEKNGEQLWKTSVSSDVMAHPIVQNGRVIAKTMDGNLYAFKLATGEKLWLSEHGAPSLVLKASSSPVMLDNNLILVGYADGKLDGIDAQTGQTRWQQNIAYAKGASDVERLVDIDADPIVNGNEVILGSYQGYVGALSLNDGQFAWQKPASIYRNMAVSGNTIYMTDSHDVVWSIDKNSGRVNWKQVDLKARGLTEPVIVGNKLFIGDKTGVLHVLSAQTGKFMARATMPGPINVAPVAANNTLYVYTANGKLSSYAVS